MFRKNLNTTVLCYLLSFLCFANLGWCDNANPSGSACVHKEELFETEHTILLQGNTLAYKAVVGSLILKNDNCEPKANLFFISYTKNNATGPRPITFCFNGGPGSSSVWLHMGLAGPKHIAFSTDGMPDLPYHLEENASSLLDVTDLVFIDPVSTGYSRAIPADSAKDFYSVAEDVKSIADFIQQYLTHFNRWDSPKFLMGESYGTTRACALAEHLHSDAFVDIDGIILVSSVLNFQTIDFNVGNDLPYPLFLPSYTAAAWHHKKLGGSLQNNLQDALEQARSFASNEYTQALFKGNLLSSQERASVVQKLSDLTGLSSTYIENSDLRIPIFYFAKELLRDQKRTVGRFDSRVQGIDSFIAGGSIEYDPSMDTFIGAFTATFNHYLRNDLGCTQDARYKILTNVFPWDYSCDNEYFNVSSDLRSVVTKYPAMKVFVASGYYDLATPFFATEYTLHHLGLDPSCQHRITLKNYEGGHMMYTIPSTLIKLKADLKTFYETAQ